jgi:hypothetical protein
MHNRTLLFGSTHLKHGRHFGYWNQHLNMRMSVCYKDFFYFEKINVYKKGLGNAHPVYPDYHEVRLCCYLVITHKSYYVHYSCFTSICDLLTNSPSYIDTKSRPHIDEENASFRLKIQSQNCDVMEHYCVLFRIILPELF